MNEDLAQWFAENDYFISCIDLMKQLEFRLSKMQSNHLFASISVGVKNRV